MDDEEQKYTSEIFEKATSLDNENDDSDDDDDDIEGGTDVSSKWSSTSTPVSPGFTGVVTPPLSSGGHVSGSGSSASVTSPGWLTTPSPYTPTTYPTTSPIAPKKSEPVRLPSKTTRKVLIAFIEEEEGAEDQIVWAAHLQMEDISININADPEDRDYMDLTLSLEDHYGNNKK